MKIFLGLTEIAGFLGRLRSGFEQLGHDADCVKLYQDAYAYGETSLIPETLTRIFAAEKARMVRRTQIPPVAGKRPFTWFYALKARIRDWGEKCINIFRFLQFFYSYDAAIFIAGYTFSQKTGLVGFNDLFWLKCIRVKIIALFCGSDSRPAFLDGAWLSSLSSVSPESILQLTRTIAANNHYIEKYAAFIVSNVFSSYFFSKSLVALQAIGNPALVHMPALCAPTPRQAGDVITILHAPSARDVKGTAVIQQVIDRLIQAGYPIRFILLTGVSNHQVLEAMVSCDLVIDQLYSDYPMASFATEAACYGKPVIVGSYVPYVQFVQSAPDLGVPPCIMCFPDALEETLLDILKNPEKLITAGQKAAEYVRAVLHPALVAQRYIDLIMNKSQPSWFVLPQAFISLLPMGMDKKRMLEMTAMIARQVDVPREVQKLLELASAREYFDS